MANTNESNNQTDWPINQLKQLVNPNSNYPSTSWSKQLTNQSAERPTDRPTCQQIKHCSLLCILERFSVRSWSIATQSEVSSCTAGRFFRECKPEKAVKFNSIVQARLSVYVAQSELPCNASHIFGGEGGMLLDANVVTSCVLTEHAHITCPPVS
jgi:hypothetical protein